MYHVDIVNKGGSTFEVASKDYSFVVDTEGAGITPPDTLLASLGSCIGVYVRKYCVSAKVPLAEFRLLVSAEFTKEAPFGFKEIAVQLDLCGLALDERRKKALLEFVHNCPVHNTLRLDPSVEITVR